MTQKIYCPKRALSDVLHGILRTAEKNAHGAKINFDLLIKPDTERPGYVVVTVGPRQICD